MIEHKASWLGGPSYYQCDHGATAVYFPDLLRVCPDCAEIVADSDNAERAAIVADSVDSAWEKNR